MDEADRGMDDSGALFAMLEEVGVANARALGLDHPGIVALCHANRQLEEGNPGLAMHTLEVELGEPDTPMPIEVGAAAFVLRGKAHEAQDRAYQRGGIPQELSSLRNLESLSLESNRLSGDLLADMGRRVDAGHFENLRGLGLGLQGNRLTGCIPLSLRGILGATTQLELPYCECPASSPGERAGLPNLGTDADGVMLLPFETLDLPAGRYRIGSLTCRRHTRGGPVLGGGTLGR